MRLMSTPKFVDIDITNRCNLRCRYCYHYESAGDAGGDLPASEWLQFFEELNRCAVTEVMLAGGEPFIRADLEEIIGGIVRNRMRFSILSNGTLITEDMAAFLASTRRCNYVQISIDGSIPMTHDAMRGKGSFAKAIEGLMTLRRYGVHATVRVTIHRKNVHELEKIATLLLEELGLPSFSTNSASHMGLCRKNAEMVQLKAGERSLAMETLFRLAGKYNGRITALAGPLAEARMWGEMIHAREDGVDGMEGRGRLAGCGCTASRMAVRADGVLVPCAMLSHVELGRINQDDLATIWKGHSGLKALRGRSEISLGTFLFCEGCEYLRYCTGSCPGLAWTMVGEINHPAPDACLRAFLRGGGKLPMGVLCREGV
jgi:SynChlorMet cassette radical SAM/SPASM protein ScmE